MKYFKSIEHKNQVLALIIYSEFQTDGIEFFTDENFSQQLGYMNRPKDYIITPHRHNPVSREVLYTQEVLFIKSGKVRVDFYSDAEMYIKSTILNNGDIILLASGGHGFKFLEKSEIIEVKQGPYSEKLDKIRFEMISDDAISY